MPADFKKEKNQKEQNGSYQEVKSILACILSMYGMIV